MNFKTIIKLKPIQLLSILSIAIIIGSVTISCNPDETQTVTNFNTITKQDEFLEDGAPDANLWSYDIGTGDNGWGNNELQYYTDRSENVVVENGMLKITALQEDFEGSSYTSARLLTKVDAENDTGFQQEYGRFEARIKLPWGQGLWPAFWLLGSNICEETQMQCPDGNTDITTCPGQQRQVCVMPENGAVWPNCGEIDIMENRGQEPTLINGTVHGPNYSGAQGVGKSYELQNDRFDTGFHTFGIEWGENYINYYVDDVLYNQITPADVNGEWVFNQPFFIVINLAVGGNYVGAPNENTVFPQTMEIDYVRVYSAN